MAKNIEIFWSVGLEGGSGISVGAQMEILGTKPGADPAFPNEEPLHPRGPSSPIPVLFPGAPG